MNDAEPFNDAEALAAFLALSQEPRLRIVRLLVVAAPDGLPAGSITATCGMSASNISFHLNHLERAGLIRSRRRGRSVIYSVVLETISGLSAFLMQDCCGGRADLCSPAPKDGCRTVPAGADRQGPSPE